MPNDDPKAPKSPHPSRNTQSYGMGVAAWNCIVSICVKYLTDGLAVVCSLTRTLHNSVQEVCSFCAQTIANGCYLQSVDWRDLICMPHLWQRQRQGCTNFPKIWVAPQHFSVFQKADMKFLTRGPTYIRRCTYCSRRGELTPGILALLVKGACTLEWRQEGWFLVQWLSTDCCAVTKTVTAGSSPLLKLRFLSLPLQVLKLLIVLVWTVF